MGPSHSLPPSLLRRNSKPKTECALLHPADMSEVTDTAPEDTSTAPRKKSRRDSANTPLADTSLVEDNASADTSTALSLKTRTKISLSSSERPEFPDICTNRCILFDL